MKSVLFFLLAAASYAGAAEPAVTPSPVPAAASDEALWDASNQQFRASYFYATYLLAQAQGKDDEAIALLQNASDADPTSVYLLRELAGQYAEHNDADDAAAALQKALQLQPRDDGMRQDLARFYIHEGNTGKAKALFLGVDGSEPTDMKSLKALAALDMVGDKWKEAGETLARLVKLFPDARDERDTYAEVLIHLGKQDEAAAQFKLLLQEEPGRTQTAYELAQLDEDRGLNADAIKVLKDAMAQSKDKTLLKSALSRAYYNQGDFQTAEKGFSELLKGDPKDTESQLFRGMARLQAKQYLLAEQDFLALSKSDLDNPSRLYGLGVAQSALGKNDDAEGTFKQLVALHPDVVPGYTQLAYIYDKTSRTAEAVSVLRDGVKANPESAELYLLLGSAQLDQGQPKKAEATFLQGITATGNSTEIRFQLAVLYDKDGDFPSAQKQLETIINVEPGNGEALNYLGYSWVDRDMKLKEAEALIRRALVAEPGNHYYEDSLGWACYKLGQYSEAEVELKKAVQGMEVGPDEWLVFQHLARVYEKLGDDKDARINFDKAKQLKPKS